MHSKIEDRMNVSSGPVEADPASMVFQDIVAADAKGVATAEQSAWLRRPAVLVPWLMCLTDMAESIETQFARAAEEEAMDEIAELNGQMTEAQLLKNRLERTEWKRKAGRMRRGLRVRSLEAQLKVSEQQNTLALQAVRLREAILEHRWAVLEDKSADPHPADESLWALVLEG
jgi:hypothetical protein